MHQMMETCPEYIGDLIKEAVVVHIASWLFSQFTLSKYSVIKSFTK